ncbi:MAG TPA: nuclear transport factor 2 family protein [Pseudonocardia sp.]|jgi:hypothetical protein|uniref:nuclear transport factor 2 family protein n=1 Tax=Pseudonocardia sp. TaxID=60912 RepID=UPI002B4AB710|nr:nuclear transport factor 2 family protein [Pseudonocardia sp.]HLU57338.1 nuclear transport factor 2 family protein [Pseudonocardia sp.]
MGERDLAAEQANKDRIRAAFESWAAGTGGPFDLLADDASWTIVGTTPVSGTYESRRAFLDSVVAPFNARMQTPLRPRVRALFSEGDWVIALFDAGATARDGEPYENTYTWYLRLSGEAIVEVIAFFDAVEFTDLWNRVAPA